MIFGSVCSGIEAASVAWGPLGWKAAFFSEIEPFPCRLLKHRYPDVPNLGDMTNYKTWIHYAIDVLCGGTPCQTFSNAGLRAGLSDPRGQLMLSFGAIAAKYRPRWLVWENVPGVLSNNDGRDFADFLGLLTGQHVEVPRGGWQSAGVVSGIDSAYGVAYRVLDAQYFGLAQRRARVFVVGHLGDWRPAAAVLLERAGLQGDPAPRRGTEQDAADRPVSSLDASYGRLQGTSGQDANHGHSHLIAGTLEAANGRTRGAGISPASIVAYGGNNTAGPIDVATAVRAHGSFHGDFETETFLAGTLTGGGRKHGGYSTDDIPLVGTLRATQGGPDVDHAMAGHFIPMAFPSQQSGTQACETMESDLSPSLQSASRMAVAFKASHFTRGKDGAPNDIVPALSADADKGDQDNLVLAPIAISGRHRGDDGRGYARPEHMSVDVAGTIDTMKPEAVYEPGAMAVRRFTPLECERLQGFPDHYTLIPNGRKPVKDFLEWLEYLKARIHGMDEETARELAADGPRYKAIGNSWAIPVVRWIGERIETVEAAMKEAP